MLRHFRFNTIGLGLAACACLVGCMGCASSQTPSTPAASSAAPSPAPARDTVQPAQLPAPPPGTVMVPYIPPPDRIDLCGEPVPLDDQDVWERFDREFTLIVYNHAQVYLWLKRMDRYFPWIEERLRSYNLPDDLKYVAIVESDLMPNACSPKGAAGPWQFMPSTGSAYGMRQQGSLDKRFDFERSTEGAFMYLRDLNSKFKNWSLAIAAYNCGEKRVYDESRQQGVRDYYHLKLPSETERYVIRILAVKAVLSNPGKYGYYLPKGMGYGELRMERVTLNLPSPVSIQTIATAAGTNFRELKRLNPEFRGDDIPAGSHEIKLPAGSSATFEQNFGTGRTAAASAPAPAPARTLEVQAEAPPAQPKPEPIKAKSKVPAVNYHTVKQGETLSSVARQYRMTAQEIKKANGLKSDVLTPGQKLKIP